MKPSQKDLWFKEWEQEIFGSGYGTGELPVLTVVKKFFSLITDHSYDHQVLEDELGEAVAWLLINAFSKADIIEWGTSARYGWLTSSGELLKEYIDAKSVDDLYDITNLDDIICMCKGEMHSDCGKNPFVNEKLADEIKYKKHD